MFLLSNSFIVSEVLQVIHILQAMMSFKILLMKLFKVSLKKICHKPMLEFKMNRVLMTNTN